MELVKKLRENFTYNSENGELKRVTRKNSNGSLDKDGYLIIKFKKKQYKAHRICWALHYGQFPKNVIDHKNGVKLDNRIINLRDVSQAENTRNTNARGWHIDNNTKGLASKFTIKFREKTYRRKTKKEILELRQEIDTEFDFIRRVK